MATELVLIAAQPDNFEVPWPIFLLVLVATIFLLIATRKKTRNVSKTRQHTRQLVDEYKRHHRLDDDLREVMIELENLARQVNGQIETKYMKLESVIRDADQRIARLERLLEEKSDGDAPVSDGAVRLDVVIGDEQENSDLSAENEEVQINKTVVYELADAGLQAQEIAVQLNHPIGEIELILALRGQQANQS